MIDPVGIPRAESAALGGIRRAQARMDQAAADVAHAGVVQNHAALVGISDAGRALASSLPDRSGVRPAHDLPEALIDSEIASHELAANVKVLSTALEMDETLLQLKKR
jgi:hypothetical protein